MGVILTLSEMVERRARLRADGVSLVWTNGCFDILHAGHVRYLGQARALGSALVVGVNSDASIRTLKGPARPINPLEDRMEVLAGLAAVDYVVPFDSVRCDGPLSAIQPDIFVKAGDYTLDTLDPGERAAVESHGGRIVLLDFLPGRSTTRVAEALAADGGIAKIISAAFVLARDADGRLLLVASREADGHTRWGLPGGGQEPGERLDEAAARELREETGYRAESLSYKGTIERIDPARRLHLILHLYEAAIPPGPPAPPPAVDDEVVASGWFGAAELATIPEPVLGRRQLLDYLRDPVAWPAYTFMGPGEE